MHPQFFHRLLTDTTFLRNMEINKKVWFSISGCLKIPKTPDVKGWALNNVSTH